MNIDDRILLFRRILWLVGCFGIAGVLYSLYPYVGQNEFSGWGHFGGNLFGLCWMILCIFLRLWLARISSPRLAALLRRARELRMDSGVRAREAEPQGLFDEVFTWIANIFVLALLVTYGVGYFLLAEKLIFATPIVLSFIGIVMLSVIFGSIVRIFVSPRTLLAYAMSFTVGMLIIGALITATGYQHLPFVSHTT